MQHVQQWKTAHCTSLQWGHSQLLGFCPESSSLSAGRGAGWKHKGEEQRSRMQAQGREAGWKHRVSRGSTPALTALGWFSTPTREHHSAISPSFNTWMAETPTDHLCSPAVLTALTPLLSRAQHFMDFCQAWPFSEQRDLDISRLLPVGCAEHPHVHLPCSNTPWAEFCALSCSLVHSRNGMLPSLAFSQITPNLLLFSCMLPSHWVDFLRIIPNY